MKPNLRTTRLTDLTCLLLAVMLVFGGSHTIAASSVSITTMDQIVFGDDRRKNLS